LLACRMKQLPSRIEPPTSISPKEQADNGPFLVRWRFHLKTGKVREEQVDDLASEFPRIPEHLIGRKTRFGYTMRLNMNGFVRYDLEKGTSEQHLLGKGRTGGEGVFVPRPEGKDEGDGWLLSYVYDEATDRSELVVIATADFKASPVARVLLPVRVPHGFHATWVPGEALRKRA